MVNQIDRTIDEDYLQQNAIAARGDDGVDPYGGLNVQMERGTHLQMDTLIGFIQSAPLDRDEKDFVMGAAALGMKEYVARVNNRFGELRTLRKQLEGAVGDTKVFEEPLIPRWNDSSEAQVMAPLPSAVWKYPVAKQIRYIQMTVRVDQQTGEFQDFTWLHDHYKFLTPEEVYRVVDVGEFPFFIRESFTVCETARNGTRNVQVQAVIARMLAHLSPEDAARQRGAQKGQKGGKPDVE